MDFRITAEEEVLVFRLAELLDGGTQPLETQLVQELGPDIRQQLEGLKAKGWILVREAADGNDGRRSHQAGVEGRPQSPRRRPVTAVVTLEIRLRDPIRPVIFGLARCSVATSSRGSEVRSPVTHVSGVLAVQRLSGPRRSPPDPARCEIPNFLEGDRHGQRHRQVVQR
ncbi:hypothetical protein TNCT6_35430 [Streptomyces sp. 6-11-2]|nr:hypothetical protein TNCT6_35430 [Streptomyces sp. 6-11-2]